MPHQMWLLLMLYQVQYCTGTSKPWNMFGCVHFPLQMCLPWLLDKFLQSAFKLIYIPPSLFILSPSAALYPLSRVHHCVLGHTNLNFDATNKCVCLDTCPPSSPPPPPPQKKKKKGKDMQILRSTNTTEERQQVLCLFVLGFILHSLNVQHKLFHLIQMGVLLLRSFILVFFASKWSLFQCIL